MTRWGKYLAVNDRGTQNGVEGKGIIGSLDEKHIFLLIMYKSGNHVTTYRLKTQVAFSLPLTRITTS